MSQFEKKTCPIRARHAGLKAAVILCLVAHAAPSRALAQWAGQRPPATDAELDKMLAAHDWNALAAALPRPQPGPELSQSMHWLHKHVDEGAGSFIAMAYTRDLWTEGERDNVTNPSRDMRVLAAAMTLYTYELIAIDGTACADRTAPDRRNVQLLASRKRILAFAANQPESVKTEIIDFAMGLEQKTAQRRGPDDLLCRDGASQTEAALKAGAKPPPPRPGHDAVLEAPPGWSPQFLPPSTYKPAQQQVRQGMKPRLAQLVSLEAGPRLP